VRLQKLDAGDHLAEVVLVPAPPEDDETLSEPELENTEGGTGEDEP
jgi:hypothetical protein